MKVLRPGKSRWPDPEPAPKPGPATKRGEVWHTAAWVGLVRSKGKDGTVAVRWVRRAYWVARAAALAAGKDEPRKGTEAKVQHAEWPPCDPDGTPATKGGP